MLVSTHNINLSSKFPKSHDIYLGIWWWADLGVYGLVVPIPQIADHIMNDLLFWGDPAMLRDYTWFCAQGLYLVLHPGITCGELRVPYGCWGSNMAGYMQSKRFIHCTIAIDLDMPLLYLFIFNFGVYSSHCGFVLGIIAGGFGDHIRCQELNPCQI